MASPILILVFLFSSLTVSTTANSRAHLVSRTCNESHVNNVSAFLNNHLRAMRAVEMQVTRIGFGYASKVDPPSPVYIMAQCHGDLSPSDCSECFSQAQSLLPACFPSVGGRVYLDGCFLRAESYNFYDEITTPQDLTVCGLAYSVAPGFENSTLQVIDRMVERVPRSYGFSRVVENLKYGQVFALGTCWKTLDQNSCALCLQEAVDGLSSCLPATEGRTLNAGCFLRYSDTLFFNKTGYWINRRIIVAYCIGTLLLSITAIYVGVCLGKVVYKRISDAENKSGMNRYSSIIKNLKFKYSTLEKAANYFSESNKLGQGGFGQVYKGSLADGRQIAIKRLFVCANKNKGNEILNEINVISRAQHKNLVRFLGCSLNGPESLLVYEYLPNKSLDNMLFDDERKRELDWKIRFAIIMGIAEGLEYLHIGCRIKIIHRDIKASNILLDIKLRPKIADFGLAKCFSAEDSHASTGIMGTLGYMAPEYIAHGKLTEKADVYSFGILVLEIINGRRNNKFDHKEPLDTLVTSAWKHFQSNELSLVVDESLELNDIEEASRVAQIALLCTQQSPSLRPSMTMVIQLLKQKESQIPIPSKPPFLEMNPSFNVSDSTPLQMNPSFNNIEPR